MLAAAAEKDKKGGGAANAPSPGGDASAWDMAATKSYVPQRPPGSGPAACTTAGIEHARPAPASLSWRLCAVVMHPDPAYARLFARLPDSDMDKALEHLQHEFANLRSGRATPGAWPNCAATAAPD